MPTVTYVCFDGDDGEGCEELLVEDLGQGRYRLHEFPLSTEAASYFDLIEADRRADGGLQVRRVVPSGLRSWRAMVVGQGDVLDGLCAAVMAAGGNWQLDWGGLLSVALPPGAELAAHPWLDGPRAAARPEGPSS